MTKKNPDQGPVSDPDGTLAKLNKKSTQGITGGLHTQEDLLDLFGDGEVDPATGQIVEKEPQPGDVVLDSANREVVIGEDGRPQAGRTPQPKTPESKRDWKVGDRDLDATTGEIKEVHAIDANGNIQWGPLSGATQAPNAQAPPVQGQPTPPTTPPTESISDLEARVAQMKNNPIIPEWAKDLPAVEFLDWYQREADAYLGFTRQQQQAQPRQEGEGEDEYQYGEPTNPDDEPVSNLTKGQLQEAVAQVVGGMLQGQQRNNANQREVDKLFKEIGPENYGMAIQRVKNYVMGNPRLFKENPYYLSKLGQDPTFMLDLVKWQYRKMVAEGVAKPHQAQTPVTTPVTIPPVPQNTPAAEPKPQTQRKMSARQELNRDLQEGLSEDELAAAKRDRRNRDLFGQGFDEDASQDTLNRMVQGREVVDFSKND